MEVKMSKANSLIPVQRIEKAIFLIRRQKVMLSSHLAELYGVETRVLNQAVKRNISRFPEDFMFQLSTSEAQQLVSQNVIPHKKYFGGSLPYAFTEQGVAMLSSVLSSERAIHVNIEIMRAFVRLRRILASHAELARKLEELEKKYDSQFKVVFDAIRQLMAPRGGQEKKIGFQLKEKRAVYRSR
jgi:hypothetical protein